MKYLRQVWAFMRSDAYCREVAIAVIDDILAGRKEYE